MATPAGEVRLPQLKVGMTRVRWPRPDPVSVFKRCQSTGLVPAGGEQLGSGVFAISKWSHAW